MTQAWVALTGADGRDIASPTEAQLAAALAEVYAGKHGAEPVTASLRFGYDDGLMYVIDVSSDGAVRFEEWSDRDCEIALASPRSMKATQAQALELWRALAQRQVARIRALAWDGAH